MDPQAVSQRLHLRWFHLYFLFAGLDVAIIVASLVLHHMTLHSFDQLVREVKHIGEQREIVSSLRTHLVNLNAHGNNVFENRNVDREAANVETSYSSLSKRLELAERELSVSAFRREVEGMVAAERTI